MEILILEKKARHPLILEKLLCRLWRGNLNSWKTRLSLLYNYEFNLTGIHILLKFITRTSVIFLKIIVIQFVSFFSIVKIFQKYQSSHFSCQKNRLLRKTTLLNLSPELLQEKIVAFAQSTQKFFQEFRHILFFQEFRIVYKIGSKQYKCTIQYVEYVFLPHFSCFFSRIQISSSQSTQNFFKNSDYLHWILKEKSNEMEFCLTFEKIPIMFFFYSENLPLHKSTQKFFKNSSKKRGVGFV